MRGDQAIEGIARETEHDRFGCDIRETFAGDADRKLLGEMTRDRPSSDTQRPISCNNSSSSTTAGEIDTGSRSIARFVAALNPAVRPS